MRTTTLIFITLGMIIPTGVFAGNLSPSAAPASTMVTLDDLQDRTPISSLPYAITSSGSYVLTASLTLAATDTYGITISADEVTLDLNGYSLTGPGKAVATTAHGIISGGSGNIAVFNGTVRDFRGAGIYLGGNNSQVWQIRAYNNGGDGIFIGSNGTIFDNTVRSNGEDGIQTGFGTVIRNNSARDNGNDGIHAGDGSVVIGNACYANTGDGIEASACLVAENACTSNTAANLNLTTCTSANNHAP